MKTKLMLAGVLLTFASNAMAMDDAERARQMQLYSANQNGGAMISSQTTVDQSGNTTTTTSSTEATNIPADTTDAAAVVQPAYSTQGLSQRSLPENIVEIQTPSAAAENAPTPVIANDNKMAPIVEGGTQVAQTTVPDPEPESIDGVMTAEEREAQLKAYQEYARANPAQADPDAPYIAPAKADAAAVVTVDGPITGTAPVALTTSGSTTTTEKTTETKYTVTSRKVGLVGGRPYPAQKSEVDGGVTMERTVNGVLDTKQVVVPDTVATLKDQRAQGDYFSAEPQAKVYENTNSDVRVHEMGSLND